MHTAEVDAVTLRIVKGLAAMDSSLCACRCISPTHMQLQPTGATRWLNIWLRCIDESRSETSTLAGSLGGARHTTLSARASYNCKLPLRTSARAMSLQ